MKNSKYAPICMLSLFLIAITISSLQGQNRHKLSKNCQCGMHNTSCNTTSDNIAPLKNNTTNNSQGTIQTNTNPALPASYNFQEYVFPEPNDQGTCTGATNITAVIDEIFLSQTHRHAIGHPFLFTISERPALLQIAVTGSGASPDVQVEGVLNGTSLGTLCLNGPANLSTTIDLNLANFNDYFSVTLPKAWIKDGLVLNLTAGDDSSTLTSSDLQITPYTEFNLVLVNMDLLDYNFQAHRTPIFDDFLQELASAIPASVVRFGVFPETLRLPTLAVSNNVGVPIFLDNGDYIFLDENGLNTGYLNAAAHDVLGKLQQAAGDFPNTIFFGNTLNLDPGGWGFDGNFVSYDYTDIFIHELGHALALPHWEDEYQLTNPNPDQFNYPYAGETGSAGGRGEAWNFIQDTYEFVNPICEDANGNIGLERSDAMQREHPCVEMRPSGAGPWDGFGDFSAKAMNNYLLGSSVQSGQVEYKNNMVNYQLKDNPGYPLVTLVNGERSFTRDASQPQNTFAEDIIKLPGMEAVEQDVYLIYGSAHAFDMSATIIYDPIEYKGTLLPIIDPTDPTMFSTLQNLQYADAPSLYDQTRDITLKLMYTDGSVKHAIVPFHSYERSETNNPNDTLNLGYFSLVVPADTALCSVELYRRDFIISDANNDISGNINDPTQNITAANFMANAILMATLDYSCNCPSAPGYIPPGTACDDGNPFTTDDIEDGFCNCEGVPLVSCGQIRNSEFKESLVTWWYWGSNAASTNGEASFENIDNSSAGVATDQLEFIMNESYTINFEAYASLPRSIIFRIYDENETVFYQETVNLTTTKQVYEFSYTHNTLSTTNFSMEFDFIGEDPSVYLDNVCIENDNTTGTAHIYTTPNDITIHPNPFQDKVIVDGDFTNFQIAVYDATGTLIQDFSNVSSPLTIDLNSLGSGLYFISVLHNTNPLLCTYKIIKE